MTRARPMPRAAGFTLVEMAVALLVVGLVVGIAATTLARYQNRSDVQRAANLAQATDIERAIQGFVQANGRLPCPDQAVAGVRDGVEDCSAAAGAKLAVGWLPHKTLQIYQPAGRQWASEVAYGAYRGSTDVAELVQRYQTVSSSHAPACEGAAGDCSVSDQADIPDTSSLSYSENATTLNMLDFCAGLQGAAEASASSAQLHVTNPATQNVAYAFTLPGSPRTLVADAGYLESRHGLATPTLFQSGQANSASNDDLTRVVSFNRLYQAYDCPQRVSGAVATYHRDLAHIADEYTHRVHLANAKIMLDNAEGGVGSAERDVTFAAIGVLLATADLAIAVAEVATLNAAAVANIAVATLELADAVANTVLTAQALSDANDWLAGTRTHYADFQARLVTAGGALKAARTISHAVEQRGGL